MGRTKTAVPVSFDLDAQAHKQLKISAIEQGISLRALMQRILIEAAKKGAGDADSGN